VRAPTGQREDPFRNFNFRVEIEGVQIASFAEVSGISSETDVIEYRAGDTGPIQLLPGQTHFGPIVLRHGMTANMELWNWRQSIVDGNADRRNMAIIVLDKKGTEVARFNILNAWPSKIVVGPFNASGNDVLVEELTIVHEGVVRDR